MRTKTQIIGRGRVVIRPEVPVDPQRLMHLLKQRFGARMQIALGPRLCCGCVQNRFRLSATRDQLLVTLLKGSSEGTREMDVLALQDALEDLQPALGIRAA